LKSENSKREKAFPQKLPPPFIKKPVSAYFFCFLATLLYPLPNTNPRTNTQDSQELQLREREEREPRSRGRERRS
jgi:hypothetical protein